ncbi:hypothetical protein MRX96_027863 [Rhipicephalus microplus]|uniref:Insulin-like domain-containing protein n=1 Tax=Rhipicephalus microplus TaxID=6941 RepID=A0A9J6ECE3_RHIMP|nr:probable insulin-like peptide 7 isoform X2 [Rhipicephalus microplus]KAH8031736.1 hypothetical protein HPB51_020731 [Rhipicephalus microplus]
MLAQWTALWLGFLAAGPRAATANGEAPDWNEIFSNRNDDDWARVWHVERHRRCYHELLSHMSWVCEKDIYKMRRRKRDAPLDKDADLAEVFLKPEAALSLLSSSATGKQAGGGRRKSWRRQRLGGRGIMDECCDVQTGCSWEEYAEYCPTSRRIRNRRR